MCHKALLTIVVVVCFVCTEDLFEPEELKVQVTKDKLTATVDIVQAKTEDQKGEDEDGKPKVLVTIVKPQDGEKGEDKSEEEVLTTPAIIRSFHCAA